jgi:hypothetical protein
MPQDARGGTRSGVLRREYTDAAINGGLYRLIARQSQPLMGCAGMARRVFLMKNRTTVTVIIKIDVAACLLGFAAILSVLM